LDYKTKRHLEWHFKYNKLYKLPSAISISREELIETLSVTL
jgi:hypothetical protein